MQHLLKEDSIIQAPFRVATVISTNNQKLLEMRRSRKSDPNSRKTIGNRCRDVPDVQISKDFKAGITYMFQYFRVNALETKNTEISKNEKI